ncbi:hypothetical protein GCM10008967_36300 [Bacillus carboniphilus]|uniref:DoxX family protein n=1 Tax=Bacillus carboniphilus TaxID=86663 RepID=A0ABN0WNE2_9BACI
MKSWMKALPRYILGFIFLVAGINGYFVIFNLDPYIATSDEAMQVFQLPYLLVLEKSLEIICGCLLLINRFVPLALAILAPLIANIFLLHLLHDHSLLVLAIILLLCETYLLFIYRANFVSLFVKKAVHK